MNDCNIYFERFTKRNLKNSNQKRWNNLFILGEKHWKKIDMWKLWENDFCKKESKKFEWEKSLEDLLQYIKNKCNKRIIIIGLGHNSPISTSISIKELKQNLLDLLEGLILLEDTNIGIAINHDGDIMVFED